MAAGEANGASVVQPGQGGPPEGRMESKQGEDEDPVQKKLKLDDLPVPDNVYLIEAVLEKLDGGLNVCYFKNIGKEGLEPFMASFKSVFGEDTKDTLLVDSIGSRSDATHQLIINRKNITDRKAMRFGWALFVNESVFDPGDWGIHLCNVLNTSEEYKKSFDPTRTAGKMPYFEVTQVKFPEVGGRRKLDQVMSDFGVVRYLMKKFNLKSYRSRRRYQTDADWDELLHPYFEDTKRGRTAVEQFLAEEAGADFFSS